MSKAIKVGRALISVSDKTGVVDLSSGLAGLGIELVSTGGTARALREAGLKVRLVEEVTGSPEMLGGRVKTLHPAIHAGILARRGRPEDMERLRELDIGPIDMVVVNLYPFAETAARESTLVEEALEQIDIGGPTLLRAAAKNFPGVIVLCDPADYAPVLKKLRQEGDLGPEERRRLAAKAFDHTATYDALIYSYLSSSAATPGEVGVEERFPQRLTIHLRKADDLRYGENPHQGAALYAEEGAAGSSLLAAEQFQGKRLSFNNYTDLEAAWQLASEFEGEPFCTIVKHANPCGAALGETAAEAFDTALACDPISAFGSIVALNCDVDADAAEKIRGLFFECLIAPGYSDAALEILRGKKRARVLRCPPRREPRGFDLRRISGGILAQDYDYGLVDREQWQSSTRREPNAAENAAMEFAWRICKHVKSNAIVFATADRILGVGAGQMSRVDSVRIAAARFDAEKAGGPIAMASDAFFPFRDGLDIGAGAGATAVIQPGGSRRDPEVIAAAEEHGVAMVFTGRRHFRH